MSSVTRSLLALALAALLHGCFASDRQNVRSSNDASISLGTIEGSDIVELPGLHIGIPHVIITIPNDCDPYGYLKKDLLGTVVIVRNVFGGPPVILTASNLNDAQSEVEIECERYYDNDGFVYACPEGLELSVYQFCKQRLL